MGILPKSAQAQCTGSSGCRELSGLVIIQTPCFTILAGHRGSLHQRAKSQHPGCPDALLDGIAGLSFAFLSSEVLPMLATYAHPCRLWRSPKVSCSLTTCTQGSHCFPTMPKASPRLNIPYPCALWALDVQDFRLHRMLQNSGASTLHGPAGNWWAPVTGARRQHAR